MKRTTWPALAALGLLLLGTRPATAHDKWIELEPFSGPSPQGTKIYLATGEALQQAEHIPLIRAGAVQRFQLVTNEGPRELRGVLREDQQPIAVVPAELLRPGTSAVVIETAPVEILLEAEKFQRYLFEERLIDVLALRATRRQEDAPGKERYSRSLKALLQIGNRLDDLALRPVGQELEIIPLSHPYGLRPGAALAVRVLFRGKPLAGRAVTFANRFRSNVRTQIVRTDEKGQAGVPLERPGEWLIALVHMEPSTEPDADWRSYWSSLTILLNGERPR